MKSRMMDEPVSPGLSSTVAPPYWLPSVTGENMRCAAFNGL